MPLPVWVRTKERKLLDRVNRLKKEKIAPGVSKFTNTNYPYPKYRHQLEDFISEGRMMFGITPQVFDYTNPVKKTPYKEVEPVSEQVGKAYVVWGLIPRRVLDTVEYISRQEEKKSPTDLTNIEFRLYTPGRRLNVDRFVENVKAVRFERG